MDVYFSTEEAMNAHDTRSPDRSSLCPGSEALSTEDLTGILLYHVVGATVDAAAAMG